MPNVDDWSDDVRAADRAATRTLPILIKWVVVPVVLVAGIAIAWTKWVDPVLLNNEANTSRQSHQYTESQRSFLLQKYSACREMDAEIAAATDPAVRAAKTAQRKAFLTEMRNRAALIDPSEVPAEVATYLEDNPR